MLNVTDKALSKHATGLGVKVDVTGAEASEVLR